MKKPNLFIVGAPKSGTSFLYENLKNNNEIFLPKVKELNYFSYSELVKESYYKDFKVKDNKKYLSLYKDGFNKKYLVDASVSYFAYPKVAKRIKEFNSKAKIIIILRDPVDRAFSHYLMDIRMGCTNLSLETLLSNPNKYKAFYTQYIGNSSYIKNISNFVDVFGNENVCVLKLENLKADLIKLFNFLDVENSTEEIKINLKVNSNKQAKYKLSKFFQKNRNVTEKLKLIIPKKIINFLNKFLYGIPNRVEMNNEEKLILESLLEKDIEFYNKLS
jgi:hypothetical protein